MHCDGLIEEAVGIYWRGPDAHFVMEMGSRGTASHTHFANHITLTDLLSFYRDVLIIQMGNAVELVNVELRSELEDFASRSTAEVTLARMDAINKARTRITTTNVAPLLTIESMASSLI